MRVEDISHRNSLERPMAAKKKTARKAAKKTVKKAAKRPAKKAAKKTPAKRKTARRK